MRGNRCRTVGAFANTERKWWLNAWSGYLSLALAAGAVLIAVPEIDLWMARASYTPVTGFVGWPLGWLGVVRATFIVFYFSCLAASIACWLATRMGTARYFGYQHWRFLIVCLVVGPGLLANVGFKDQWGRAKPKHIVALATSNCSPRPCSQPTSASGIVLLSAARPPRCLRRSMPSRPLPPSGRHH